MSTYESFPSGPPKSKTGNKGLIAGVLVGVLVLITVVVVAIVIRNETKKQQQPNGGSSSLAVTSTATATHSKGAGLPVDGYYPEFQGQEWAQDGYYGTVGDGNDAAFWGVQKGPTRMPPGTMKPNEPLLGEIRRERFNYRERISNRMNMNSYSFPNTNGFWPRAAYASNVRLEVGQWPKLSTTFARPWRSESGPCGSSRPCPFAGPDNAGTVVQAFGKLSRRGMCLPSGRCDCPMGMDGTTGDCQGIAARDAFGSLVWSRSELAAPISDLANLHDTEERFETSPIISGVGGGL